MYITNITTNDLDNITDLNTTNDSNICTNIEKNIDNIIPSLLSTIPHGLSYDNTLWFIIFFFEFDGIHIKKTFNKIQIKNTYKYKNV